MCSMNYVELLYKRGRMFYDYAIVAFERGDYDMTVFMCEQAAQLSLKAILLRILGFIPRVHGIRELLGSLSKALEGLGKAELSLDISRFVEGNREDLRSLEEAYTSSRYIARVYEREDALRSLKVVEKLFKLIEKVEGDVFPH